MTNRRSPLLQVADAIASTLSSPNEADQNGEEANIVDGLYMLARALERLGNNNAGTRMGGMETLGLAIKDAASEVARALRDLAEALRETRP